MPKGVDTDEGEVVVIGFVKSAGELRNIGAEPLPKVGESLVLLVQLGRNRGI